jgi:hypothetical protein
MKTTWKHYLRRMAKVTLVGSSAMAASAASYAWAVAEDNAGSAPYADGWQTGDNGGSGFAPWVLNMGGYGASHTIDNGPAANNDLGAPAWVMANTSAYGSSDAVRPFLSPLSIGQTFSVDVDSPAFFGAGYGGWVVRLRSASGEEVGIGAFRNTPFGSTGSEPVFIADDEGFPIATTVPATTAQSGLNIAVTLTSASTYDLAISDLDGAPLYSDSGRTLKFGDVIDRVQLLFYSNPGGGFNVNNLSIVPEPATGALLLVGVGGLLLGRIRTRRSNE